MTSKTLQYVAVLVIVAITAVLLFHGLPDVVGGLLDSAAKAGAQAMRA